MHPPDLFSSALSRYEYAADPPAFPTAEVDTAIATFGTTSLLHVASAVATIITSTYLSPPSIAASTAASSPSPSRLAPSDPDDTGECKLLGPFAVLIQASLGGLALLALVFKRWRERPQRPIKIWAFDVSKQVFGSVLLHLANLFMSMFSAGEIQAAIAKAAASTVAATGNVDGDQVNPCSFYLLNLAIDTTLGIPILIILLRLLAAGASLTPLANPPESIKSGNYGNPPRATWWLKQSMIYFIGLLMMKVCVFIIFELCPWIVEVGDWALRWTEGNEAMQVAFVMLIFPLIMNALQYYIIDGFIKNHNPSDPEGVDVDDRPGRAGEEDAEGRALLRQDGESHEADIDEIAHSKNSVKVTREKFKPKSRRLKSYDPDKDGEFPGTPVGESSSSSASNLEQERPEEL